MAAREENKENTGPCARDARAITFLVAFQPLPPDSGAPEHSRDPPLQADHGVARRSSDRR
jgi:hypothetical protein